MAFCCAETKWLGHWAAAPVALGWLARVIGVGRPAALGRLPNGNGGRRSVLVSMGFTVS